jgi:hypothetical protein
MVRSAHLALAALLWVSLASAAEARHWYYWRYQPFGRYHTNNTFDNPVRERDPRFSETRSGSALGLIIDRLTGTCIRVVDELRNFPAESIARTIRTAGEQNAALENIRRIADETANTLAANCPREIEPEPAGRLEALNRSLDAVEAALKALQPLLQSLYLSLSDEQKAALVERSSAVSRETNRVVETSGIATRSRTYRGIDQAVTQDQGERNCEQLGAELRDWPIARIEQIVQLGPRQRAAFYEVAASFQHAADTLADKCPLEPAPPPLERWAELRKSLDGVRQSMMIIRPAVERFYELLDMGQKKRFRDAM